jgi:hypothetical protein
MRMDEDLEGGPARGETGAIATSTLTMTLPVSGGETATALAAVSPRCMTFFLRGFSGYLFATSFKLADLESLVHR